MSSCNARSVLSLKGSSRLKLTVSGTGLFTDLLVYSLIIPVIPFRLESLGYSGIGAKVSWLMAAYVRVSLRVLISPFLICLCQSGMCALSTPLLAHYSEVYHDRKIPLLGGLVALLGSQVMFMEAPAYWVMVLARSLQGVSSAVVWTIGLSLL
jgi:MFS family permease